MKTNTASLPTLACVMLVFASALAAQQLMAGEKYPATWPQVVRIKWSKAKVGEECPAYATVRCSPEGTCVLTARDGLGTVSLDAGDSVFVSVKYEFTKVDGEVEFAAIPVDEVLKAMAALRRRHDGTTQNPGQKSGPTK